jgi:hypothetical protein
MALKMTIFNAKLDNLNKEMNMKQIKNTTRKTRLMAVALMAGLMGAIGCGDLDRSLVNSGDEVTVQEAFEAPAGYLVFSPRTAMQVATKTVKVNQNNTMVRIDDPTEIQTMMVEHEFRYDRNKRISIKFREVGSDPSLIQVKQAQFSVEKNSIDTGGLSDAQLDRYTSKKGVDIRMQVVTGTTLEDIVVAFGPAGLAFNPVAQLRLQLVGDLTGIFTAGEEAGYHINADGVVTKVSVSIDDLDEDGCNLIIDVPGFSRYVLGDD